MFKVDNWVSGLAQYVRKGKQKKGIMIAVTHPLDPNKIIVGWSLCNFKWNKFDREKAIDYAYGRAIKLDHLDYAFYRVPASLKEPMYRFMKRAKNYFKDKTMPLWVENELVTEYLNDDSLPFWGQTSTGGYFVIDDDGSLFDAIREINNA